MIIKDLNQRGLLYQSSDERIDEKLYKLSKTQPISAYVGFDPTADSLHVGHFMGIRALMLAQKNGIRPIAIVGGATGLIGDPSGRSSERNLISKEEVEKNVAGIKLVLSKFLDFDSPTTPAKIINNLDWFGSISAIDFLRDIGKYFRLGSMLSKDSVKKRMEQDGEGISFTEFSYQLLQGYDFYRLYKDHNCVLQLGGSDQWGNITAGIDLIHKIYGESGNVFGATLPLITDNKGNKFGKSSGNAVWLSSEKTSSYDFYQFWLRTEDNDVCKFLKLFTQIDLDSIKEIIEHHHAKPHERLAQNILAMEMTKLVHGQEESHSAKNRSEKLFSKNNENEFDNNFIDAILSEFPSFDFKIDKLKDGIHLPPLLVHIGLATSNSNARKLIEGGGCYINNKTWVSVNEPLSEKNLINQRFIIIRSGKKNYRIIKISS